MRPAASCANQSGAAAPHSKICAASAIDPCATRSFGVRCEAPLWFAPTPPHASGIGSLQSIPSVDTIPAGSLVTLLTKAACSLLPLLGIALVLVVSVVRRLILLDVAELLEEIHHLVVEEDVDGLVSRADALPLEG